MGNIIFFPNLGINCILHILYSNQFFLGSCMDSTTKKTVQQLLEEEKAQLQAEIDARIRKRRSMMEPEPKNELLHRHLPHRFNKSR